MFVTLVLVDNLVSCHTNVHTKIWGKFLFTFVTKIWKVDVTKIFFFCIMANQIRMNILFRCLHNFLMNRHHSNNRNRFQISKDFDQTLLLYRILLLFSNSPTHLWNIFLCMNSDYTENSSKFSKFGAEYYHWYMKMQQHRSFAL